MVFTERLIRVVRQDGYGDFEADEHSSDSLCNVEIDAHLIRVQRRRSFETFWRRRPTRKERAMSLIQARTGDVIRV
jgi:hypothetical protein